MTILDMMDSYLAKRDIFGAFTVSILKKEFMNHPEVVWRRFLCYDPTDNYKVFLLSQLQSMMGHMEFEEKYGAEHFSRYRTINNQKLKGNTKMPEVKFTQEDLLERTQLAPGWRVLKCKNIEEGPGKNDPSSIVYSCTFSVVEGKESGVPIRHWFSEKAMGRIVDYLKCFVPAGRLEAGKTYELSQTIDLNVEGYCQYDPQQGYNTIKDWRAAKQTSAAGGNGGKK